MCYGGLDPKYQLREIEARVKALHFEQDTSKQAAADAAPDFLTWVRDVLARLRYKDTRHV